MASEGYALNNFKKDGQTKIEGINTKQQGMKPDVMALMEERQSLLSNAEALEKEIGVMFHKAHCMFERAQSIGRQISKLSTGISSIRTTKYNRVFNEDGRLWSRFARYPQRTEKTIKIMAEDLSHYLVIAVSSRALFDLELENTIFEKEGAEAYEKFQIAHEDEVLKPGPGFPLVQAILRLNSIIKEKRKAEVVVISRAVPSVALRIMNSIKNQKLDITRAAFCKGTPVSRYLDAYSVTLFLSRHLVGQPVQREVSNAFRRNGLDVAQRIKNWSAGVTRAVRQLNAAYRWGLLGTPLENNTEELWTILNVLKPEISKGPHDWSQGIQSVLRPMFLRRRKQDVLTDLPPLVQNPVWVRLEHEQRKSYDELEKQGVLELHAKGETITAQTILVLLNKLKQVCNRCPRSGESSKLVWLRDSLDDIAAEGDKVLVFSQYRDERFAGADWLEKQLAKFGALNYSKATSDQKRQELLAAFRDKPEHRVFVGHPKTAGLGLNELIAANYVVHFDHWWNPAVMNQATVRAHRPGQTKTVFAYDLWVEDTYEEIIFELLERKQGLYNEVIDSMSAQRQASDHLFSVAHSLFAKHGLKPIQRKPTRDEREIDRI